MASSGRNQTIEFASYYNNFKISGTTQLKTYEKKAVKLPKHLSTPAEGALENIVKNPAANLAISNLSDAASTALAGAARPHLKKLGNYNVNTVQ